MQIPTGSHGGLPPFPAASTKTRPRNSPSFHSCANILDDIFTGATESTDGLYTPEMRRKGWWQGWDRQSLPEKKQEG